MSLTPELPDPDEGWTDDWGSPTRCTLLDKTPPNWSSVPSHSEIRVTWTLLNSGTKKWDANEVAVVYVRETKLTPPGAKKKLFTHDIKVGETVTVGVNIYTPDTFGHYKSVWGLREIRTGRVFCTFTIKIYVY